MKILDLNSYNHVNESVRSELFKNGMTVMYSVDGTNNNYFHYIVLTDKDDIQKAIDDLKWPDTFSESDVSDIMEDKYGVIVTSRDNGARYVCISDILVNNILYIWDTDLKLDDCIKEKYIIDISDKCNHKNLIYEKDVDYAKLITTYPEPPYYNMGWNHDDLNDMTKGTTTWCNNPLSVASFNQPVTISL